MSKIVFVGLMGLWAVICVAILVIVYIKGRKEYCSLDKLEELEDAHVEKLKNNEKLDENIKIIDI